MPPAPVERWTSPQCRKRMQPHHNTAQHSTARHSTTVVRLAIAGDVKLGELFVCVHVYVHVARTAHPHVWSSRLSRLSRVVSILPNPQRDAGTRPGRTATGRERVISHTPAGPSYARLILLGGRRLQVATRASYPREVYAQVIRVLVCDMYELCPVVVGC